MVGQDVLRAMHFMQRNCEDRQHHADGFLNPLWPPTRCWFNVPGARSSSTGRSSRHGAGVMKLASTNCWLGYTAQEQLVGRADCGSAPGGVPPSLLSPTTSCSQGGTAAALHAPPYSQRPATIRPSQIGHDRVSQRLAFHGRRAAGPTRPKRTIWLTSWPALWACSDIMLSILLPQRHRPMIAEPARSAAAGAGQMHAGSQCWAASDAVS